MPCKTKQQQKVICIVMGGGRGSRLYPLTKLRCKPAVPLGGKYRLIDIPLSNCINSGYKQIYILSQFNTASLHRHIQETFKFDSFSNGFVDILSAEQTETSESWYQGTADAVRQNLGHFTGGDDDLFLILSGDQLYQMDFKKIIQHHIDTNAGVTVSAKTIPKKEAKAFGIMKVADDFSVKAFVEKPQDPHLLSELVLTSALKGSLHSKNKAYCLASMGIYVFTGKVLKRALQEKGGDFGKEIIPSLLGKEKLSCYIFDDYWEDIGTVKSFFEANLMLTDDNPPFNFYNSKKPIFTATRSLPPSKIVDCHINRAQISDGSTIIRSKLERCVIGIRSTIREGSVLESVVMMGADKFELPGVHTLGMSELIPPIGVGRNCRIKNAIIDKNARIGNNVTLSPTGLSNDFESNGVYVRDGVLIVNRDSIIPDGTHIGAPLLAADHQLATC